MTWESFDAGSALAKLSKSDARLKKMIEKIGPYRLEPTEMESAFEALAESIIYQQITGKAAATITTRLIESFAPARFPAPKQLVEASEEALRSVGISRPKVAALKDLAAKTLDGTVPSLSELHQMDDEQIIERLVSVRGIGRWTAEMLLIFRLGRPDVLPVHDYGVRKGFAVAFGLPDLPKPEEVRLRGERWRPYRTVASWYLWRASELPKRPAAEVAATPSNSRRRTKT